MSTYLSIDLDYWTWGYPSKIKNNTLEMKRYLKKILKLNIPITIFLSHEEMLPDVNKYRVDKLINLDAHSDMADNDDGILSPLDEGTWINWVKKRKEFLWIYPLKTCYIKNDGSQGSGRCDADFNPFSRNHFKICGWRNVHRRLSKYPTKKELQDVVKIGICISHRWTDKEQIYEALTLLSLDKNIQWNKQSKMFLQDQIDLWWEESEEIA